MASRWNSLVTACEKTAAACLKFLPMPLALSAPAESSQLTFQMPTAPLSRVFRNIRPHQFGKLLRRG